MERGWKRIQMCLHRSWCLSSRIISAIQHQTEKKKRVLGKPPAGHTQKRLQYTVDILWYFEVYNILKYAKTSTWIAFCAKNDDVDRRNTTPGDSRERSRSKMTTLIDEIRRKIRKWIWKCVKNQKKARARPTNEKQKKRRQGKTMVGRARRISSRTATDGQRSPYNGDRNFWQNPPSVRKKRRRAASPYYGVVRKKAENAVS